MPWQRKEVPEVGVACLVFFFIHTNMDAIFQPIKKSDTYQIELLPNVKILGTFACYCMYTILLSNN